MEQESALKKRMFDDSVSLPVLLPRLSLFGESFKPVPVLESLAGLKRPVYNLDVIISDCIEFVDNSSMYRPPVTRDDALAIAMYTYEIQEPGKMKENIYTRLNAMLRERSDEIYEWKNYIYHLIIAMRKIPAFEGTVFRGIDRSADPERYKKDRNISWNSFTSATAKEDIGKKFMKRLTTGTFFSIKVKRGRSMRGLSHFDNEEEVLIEANTMFTVTMFVVLNGITVVNLEEIDSTKVLLPLDYPIAGVVMQQKQIAKAGPGPNQQVTVATPPVAVSLGPPPPFSSNVAQQAQPKPQKPSVHPGVKCDCCGVTPIQGVRYKCWACYDFDICEKCRREGKVSNYHLPQHPLEPISPGATPTRSSPRPLEMILNRRVRRGRDWKWENQDGNSEGTAYQSTTPGWITVAWDAGGKFNYRWGAEGCYDLLVLPTGRPLQAQVPAPYPAPSAQQVVQPPPSALQAVVVNSLQDLVGKRVQRGPDWKWGNQGNGTLGTIYGLDEPAGWAKTVWDNGDKNIYRMGVDGAFDLQLIGARIGPGIAQQVKQAFPSCQQMVGKRVRRGPDWQWGTQDGDGPGKVVAVESDGILKVRWDNGGSNNYRWGASGKFDLRITADEEVSEDMSPVTALWTLLRMLHQSLKQEYLGEISLSKPDDLPGFYTSLYKYECAIKGEAQDARWLRGGRREFWEREMKGPTCTLKHAASCLYAVEMHVLGAYQRPSWKDQRKQWVEALVLLGATDLNYPEGSTSSVEDVEKLAALLAKVLATNA